MTRLTVPFKVSYFPPFLSEDVVKEVRVKCNSEDITVTVGILGGEDFPRKFNGMIYPKGLSKNSSCMTEYIQAEHSVDYVIPLRSCNTMSTEVVRHPYSFICSIIVDSLIGSSRSIKPSLLGVFL